MSNLNDNKVSVTLTVGEVNSVKALLNQVSATLPFLKGLTDEDRQSIPKINVSNKAFVEDAINAVLNNASFMPPYFSLQELQKDLALYEQLDELVTISAQVAQKLRDTQIIAGSEAYVSALTVYRLFETAARAGMPGADTVYKTLQDRFYKISNPGDTSPPKE